MQSSVFTHESPEHLQQLADENCHGKVRDFYLEGRSTNPRTLDDRLINCFLPLYVLLALLFSVIFQARQWRALDALANEFHHCGDNAFFAEVPVVN